MEVRVLGPLEVHADGGAVAVSGAKLRALLAVLALHANRPVSTERLALAVWGDEAPRGTMKAVKVQVSRLRRALGETGVLETTPAGYRLALGPDELDAERFERAVAAGRAALAAGDARGASELLRGALALWRGAPLEEFAWAPFAPPETQRLEELHLEALESRVEADLAAGRHGELVAELKRLTAEHPWRERLHVQSMLALYRSGRQADALAAYRQARRVLVDELGIEPGPELRRVHDAVLAHDASLDARPVSRTAPPRRARTLPAPPNRTIGRAGELRALIDRLRAGAIRLLSLTGPGGVGKTRLALEAARAVEPDFADGVCLVSLAAVKRPQDVPGTIVSALSIVPLAGESAEDAADRQARAAGDRQLRAPAGGSVIHRASPRGRPGNHRAGHESRTAGCQRRARLPGRAPRASRAGDADGRRRAAPRRCGCVVLRARPSARPRLRLVRRQRGRRRGDLPTTRWAAAGHRTGGGALRAVVPS